MSLRITKQNLKDHFISLGFDAEINPNAPEAPWENTAIVLSRWGQSGVKLVISINIYTHTVVEVERRVEGREAAAIAQDSQMKNSGHWPDNPTLMKLPTRPSDAVTDTTGISTLEELTSLVNDLFSVRGAQEKDQQAHTVNLSSETINVNREINRGSRDSQRSTKQAKKQVR